MGHTRSSAEIFIFFHVNPESGKLNIIISHYCDQQSVPARCQLVTMRPTASGDDARVWKRVLPGAAFKEKQRIGSLALLLVGAHCLRAAAYRVWNWCSPRATYAPSFAQRKWNGIAHFFRLSQACAAYIRQHMCALLLTHALFVGGVEFSFKQDFATSDLLLRDGSYQAIPSDGSLMMPNSTAYGGVSSRVVYKDRIQLYNTNSSKSFSFSTSFTFTRADSGDGFAFLITPTPKSVPPSGMAGGWLGIYDAANGSTNPALKVVALEFDLVQNGWDSNAHHVGLDVSSIKSLSFSDPIIFGFNLSYDKLVAWIDFDAKAKTLTLWMAKFPDEKASAVRILQQSGFDLSACVEESSFVGFSAANGGSGGFTTLHHWNFSSFLADDVAATRQPPDTSSLLSPPPGPILAAPESPQAGPGSNAEGKETSKTGLDQSTIITAIVLPITVVVLGAFLTWCLRQRGQGGAPAVNCTHHALNSYNNVHIHLVRA